MKGIVTRYTLSILFCSLFLNCQEQSYSEPLDISWRFVDDRTCDLAATPEISIRLGDSHRRVPCSQGFLPESLSLEAPQRPLSLVVEAKTISDSVMYRWTGTVEEDWQGSKTLTLRFIGGTNERHP